MVDYMQEIENIMDNNKDVLERLKHNYHVDFDTLELFARAKSALAQGYPVYAIIETDNMAKNVELVDSWQWSASHVLVKLQDGTKVRVPMNSVKMIKC
jgi:hypothetical protein